MRTVHFVHHSDTNLHAQWQVWGALCDEPWWRMPVSSARDGSMIAPMSPARSPSFSALMEQAIRLSHMGR